MVLGTNEKVNLEITREKLMIDSGRQRFLKRQEGLLNSSTQNNGQKIINSALVRVATAIRQTIETQADSKSRNPCWYDDLVNIEPDLLAYIALNTCMESVAVKATVASCLSRIGRRIELEHWAAGLKDHDQVKARRIETQVSKAHNSTIYRIKAARITAAKDHTDSEGNIVSGYRPETWLPSRLVKVAAPLLNAVLEFSEIFDVWDASKPKKTVKKMGMTEEAQIALANMDHKASWLEPQFGPMLIPPTPWTAYDTGCYRDAQLASQVPLVRAATNEQRNAIVHDIKKYGDAGPEYLEALNAIQATPLQINEDMLEAVRWAWFMGIQIKDFPMRSRMEIPPVPVDWDELEDTQQKAYSILCRDIARTNRDSASQSVVMSQDMATALDLTEFDELYLPWNMDFRGRCYPIPHFNYHRDDHIKSLFQLARGENIDTQGAAYLAIHLANCGDFAKISKASLYAREEWTNENSDWLCSIAADYRGTVDQWSKADKPFQFLAAAFAWKKWVDHGELYNCQLPLSLDGSNSGLQHYSAASLDANDGALVNLTPSESPRDIYQSVADLVKERVEAVARDYKDEHHVIAKAWLSYGITRKVCKRNTMTYAYSSPVFGMGDQLIEDIMVPLSKQVLVGKIQLHPFGPTSFETTKAARWLAAINMSSIRAVISSAQNGMDFLKGVAGALSHEGKPVRWKTPIGFPVVQKYTEYEVKKVKMTLYDRDTHASSKAEREVAEREIAEMKIQRDLPEIKTTKRTQVTVRERASSKINKRKSKGSISPNFIHGLDSAHLMKTVLRAKDSGVEDFFLIHDSFASMPNDTPIIYAAVRETFVEMYDGRCVYTDLLVEVRQQLSVRGRDTLEIKVPEKGTLNLQGVLESEYCFA